jgi:hypothetical protein
LSQNVAQVVACERDRPWAAEHRMSSPEPGLVTSGLLKLRRSASIQWPWNAGLFQHVREPRLACRL